MDFKRWLHLCERNYVDGKPFLDSLDALKYIRDKHPNPENVFVTFTNVDKVGINPRSEHKVTPLGIYLYAIDYVIEVGQKVEFAGDTPYIQVCELTKPEQVLRMRKTNSDEGTELLYRVFDKDKVDEALGREIKNMSFYRRINVDMMGMSNYATLWNVTKALCQEYEKRTRLEFMSAWNKAFRDMGISGFVDEGTGTIFPTEPYQAVMFRAGDLRVLHTLENTWRLHKRMPSHEKTGEYDLTTGPYSEAENFYRKFFRAEDDEAKGQIMDKSLLSPMLRSAKNKKFMLNLIFKYRTKWNSDDVSTMLSPTVGAGEDYGLRQMARALGRERIALLTPDEICSLLVYARDVREMGEAIGQENLDKLGSEQIRKALIRDRGAKIAAVADLMTPRRMDKLTVDDLVELVDDMDRVYDAAGAALAVLTPANLQNLKGEHLGIPIPKLLIDNSGNPEAMRALLARYLGAGATNA